MGRGKGYTTERGEGDASSRHHPSLSNHTPYAETTEPPRTASRTANPSARAPSHHHSRRYFCRVWLILLRMLSKLSEPM